MMKILFAQIVALGFIALAAYLIYLNRDGWGWCVFCAVLTCVSNFNETKKDKE